MTVPRRRHGPRGWSPPACTRIEQLTARPGDSVDTGPTGDQYPAIFQKCRGVPDVAVEKIGRSHPCTRFNCLRLSGQRPGDGEPGQHPGYEYAPKQRLHGSLATAGLP